MPLNKLKSDHYWLPMFIILLLHALRLNKIYFLRNTYTKKHTHKYILPFQTSQLLVFPLSQCLKAAVKIYNINYKWLIENAAHKAP